MAVRKPIVSRGRGKTDFGKGFYTTTSREQAEKWAQIKRDRMGDEAHAIVSVFELDDAVMNNPAYHTRHFDGATAEWLDFVVGNRRGEVHHNFDLIMGPVANDRLYATITLYENGILDANAAIEQLNTHQLFDQLSFHTTKACKLLTFVETFEL
jgi:hypothetical protein